MKKKSINGRLYIEDVDLSSADIPKRNDALEDLLTEKWSPFIGIFESKKVLADIEGVHKTFTIEYTSLWNLAVKAVETGAAPSSVAGDIRAVMSSVGAIDIETAMFNVSKHFSENKVENADQEEESYKTKLDPFITSDLIKTLAEEGIMEDAAKKAVMSLLKDGSLSRQCIKPGGIIYMYGNDRRRIVSRILNRITEMRL